MGRVAAVLSLIALLVVLVAPVEAAQRPVLANHCFVIAAGKRYVRALERLGFAVARQRGSHIVLRRGSAPAPCKSCTSRRPTMGSLPARS